MAEVSDLQLAQLGNKLERISIRVNSFGSSLATISNQMAQTSALEQMKEKQEQDRQRILAEQQLAAGKESVFERKMQSALVKPLQGLQGKTAGALETLKRFFLSLGVSWLTKQGFEALKAQKEGNRTKLEEIRDSVVSTIRKVFLVFTILKRGVGRVIRAIFGISGKIFNAIFTGLIKKPFRALMNAIRGALRVATNTIGRMFGRAPRSPIRQPQTGRPPGGRPNRGGGNSGGIFGGLFNGISGFMNFRNEEYVDTAILALSMFGPGRIVRGLMAATFTADEIFEAFGSNLFGKDPNAQKQADAVREEVRPLIQSQPAQAETSSNVEPTEGLMGGKSMGDDHHDGGVEANPSQANFQNLDEPTPADVSPAGSSEPPAAQVSSPGNMSTPASSVGPTPAPAPEVNILPQTPQATEVPSEQAPNATDIPRVVSFNKDNFYPLYSQVNYNVVT